MLSSSRGVTASIWMTGDGPKKRLDGEEELGAVHRPIGVWVEEGKCK